MGANTSPAVMAQRNEAPNSLDDFPTPPWATRALLEHVLGRRALVDRTVWEPAANRGYMVHPLQGYGADVRGSDIFDYGAGFPVFDFLGLAGAHLGFSSGAPPFPEVLSRGRVDWIITNPPFNCLNDWIRTALAVTRIGIAMFARTQVLESLGRYESIFDPLITPPGCWSFSQFAERVPLQKGRLVKDGTTATAYGWLTIWQKPQEPEYLLGVRHIPRCRDALERPGDYPE